MRSQMAEMYTEKIGSPTLRALWSERRKRQMWRSFWYALARGQKQCDLVTDEELKDIQAHVSDVDMEQAALIEKVIKHDLMSEVKVYASQCLIGGGKIHLGATSADVEENVDALRIRLSIFEIRQHVNYFLSMYLNRLPFETQLSLLSDLDTLLSVAHNIRGKGVKGAVGTSSSYTQLLEGSGFTAIQLEEIVMHEFGLPPFSVSTQVATRKQELNVASSVSMLAITMESMSTIPSSSLSAIPDSFIGIRSKYAYLMSLIKSIMGTLWDNASHSLLERTLDDSANRREALPVLFLAVDEMIHLAEEALKG